MAEMRLFGALDYVSKRVLTVTNDANEISFPICYNSFMQKSYSKKIILLIALFLAVSSAFCKTGAKSKSPKTPKLSVELSEKITNIRNYAFSSDGKWYFINAEKQSLNSKEKLNTL